MKATRQNRKYILTDYFNEKFQVTTIKYTGK